MFHWIRSTNFNFCALQSRSLLLQVIFMISREPAPMLEDKEKWSLLFHDWVAKCLSKDPRVRPTAQSLLQVKTQP
jgi:serine/threonine protein kinase